MNLYRHKEIKNSLDRRLVDLFVMQNQSNDWLTVAECASWVFQTNNPSQYHRTYTQNKLTSLVGSMGTTARRQSMFDMQHAPAERGRFVYRLKSDAPIKATQAISLKEQLDEVYSRPSNSAVAGNVREHCLDEIDF